MFVLFFWFSALYAQDTDYIGTVTELEGSVKIFSNPHEKLPTSPGVHVLYEGLYYDASTAKIGDTVDQKCIVRTAIRSKAGIVFANGDQIRVSPASATRMTWQKNDTSIELAYGAIRGVIEKGGPRSHLKVATRSAIMGVRGTDFFIANVGEHTEVSILRGAVELKPTHEAAPILVATGQTGTIQGTKPPQTRPTTQEDLTHVMKTSHIISTAPITQAVEKKIIELQKQALTSTLQDIKATDPELFKKVSNQSLSLNDLNAQSVAKIFEQAPKAAPKAKPLHLDEGDDPYEQYFQSL